MCNTAADRAGLTDVVFHDLRRTWATWAAQRGVDLYEIADILMDNPMTVQKHYRKHMPHHALRRAVNYRTPDELQTAAE